MKQPFQLGLIAAIVFLALLTTASATPVTRSGFSSVLTVRDIGKGVTAHLRCETCSIAAGLRLALGDETEAVPEPTFFILLGLGLAALVARRRWAQH